jgi:hypothetical protein
MTPTSEPVVLAVNEFHASFAVCVDDVLVIILNLLVFIVIQFFLVTAPKALI